MKSIIISGTEVNSENISNALEELKINKEIEEFSIIPEGEYCNCDSCCCCSECKCNIKLNSDKIFINIEKLISVLEENNNIKKLVLINCNLNINSVLKLSKSSSFNKINILDISHNNISRRNWSELEGLVNNYNLLELNVKPVYSLKRSINLLAIYNNHVDASNLELRDELSKYDILLLSKILLDKKIKNLKFIYNINPQEFLFVINVVVNNDTRLEKISLLCKERLLTDLFDLTLMEKLSDSKFNLSVFVNREEIKPNFTSMCDRCVSVIR